MDIPREDPVEHPPADPDQDPYADRSHEPGGDVYPDGPGDQDAEPPTPDGAPAEPEQSGPHSDPTPGGGLMTTAPSEPDPHRVGRGAGRVPAVRAGRPRGPWFPCGPVGPGPGPDGP